MSPKRSWTRPELTPLTQAGSRSDTPDTPARNGGNGIINGSPEDVF